MFDYFLIDLMTAVVAGIANGSIYALIGIGLVMVYKTQAMLQFSQGEFFMAGAFIGLTAYSSFGADYVSAFLLALAGGAALGLLSERILFRPLMDSPHFTLVMLTIGLSLMMKGAARVPFGGDIYVFPPMFKAGPVFIAGVAVSLQSIVILVVGAVMAVLLHLLFKYSSLGKQMRATASSLTGARVIGVNIGRVHATTWALAGALGAGAGVLAGPITLLHPEMGSMGLLKGFAAAVLGGFNNVPGAILGGLLMGVIEMLFGTFIATQFMNVSAFVVIAFVLLFFPRGLFGTREVKRV